MKRIIFTLGFALVGSCLNHDGNLGADRRDGTGGSGSTGSGGTAGSNPEAAGGGTGDASTAGSAGTAGSENAGDGGERCGSAEGTWSLSYEGECFNGNDIVFVTRTGPGPNDYRVRFVNRPPLPAGCAETDEPVYSTAAQFDESFCLLKVTYNAGLCASGNLRCTPPQGGAVSVGVHLTLRTPDPGTWAGTMVCPPPPQTQFLESSCSVRSTRLAGPGDCQNVIMNGPCDTTAVCDSGCGTPCRCEGGLWLCEYPKLGQACWDDERCFYREQGVQEEIQCATLPGGQPMLMASENPRLPTVCPAEPPQEKSPCNLYPRGLMCSYPGNTPGHCSCEARDATIDEWRCIN